MHVAFTPAGGGPTPVGIVVDVLRATSTITQALASGWPRVLCAPGIEEALAVREQLGEGLLGGERDAKKIEGFDVGASPREFAEGGDVPLVFSTTNGTRAILTAARCDRVFLGSLLNLDAVAAAARESGEDVPSSARGSRTRSRSTTRTAPEGSSSWSAATGPMRRKRPS